MVVSFVSKIMILLSAGKIFSQKWSPVIDRSNLVEKKRMRYISFVSLRVMEKQQLLNKIKETVRQVAPGATVILYGSYARGEESKYSDIDLLILVDKKDISYQEQKRISYPLYDIGIDMGEVISPFIINREKWETLHRITPLYENIQREGIVL